MILDYGRPPLHDRHLDIPRDDPTAIASVRGRALQRLVVDPLPMVLGCVASGALIWRGLQARDLPLFLAAVGLFAASLPLFRYRCLDCGRSGWYRHAGRHACEAVRERARRGDRGGAIPSARTQFVLWVYIIVGGLVVASVFALGRL